MPKANRKNLKRDQQKSRGGEWNGGDVTWTGEDVNDHIEKWMKDMGMYHSENDIPKSGLIGECVIATGQINGNMTLVKNRDRTYKPTMAVIRYRTKKGIEIAIVYDKNTQYLEGMNEYGIGILNSTMLNEIDSDVEDGYNREQGKIVFKALNCKTIDEAIGVLTTQSGGLEGHTMIADQARAYHIEMLKGSESHVIQLDPSTGWDARTNHGVHFPEGGYMPRDGQIYMSSNYRKALAEIELAQADSPKRAMAIMRQQHNEPESHMNFHRRVPNSAKEHPNFMTTSQVVMDLGERKLYFHSYSKVSDFSGDIEDLLPKDYKPKIKIAVSESDH